MRRIKKSHPARMAPRHTAIDADEPSVAATALIASNVAYTAASSQYHSRQLSACVILSLEQRYQNDLRVQFP